MSYYRIVVQIRNEINRYQIKADTPKQALKKFYDLVDIQVAANDPNANYEVIYSLKGSNRKTYLLVCADNARRVFKRVKEKLGELYDKIQIDEINELKDLVLID